MSTLTAVSCLTYHVTADSGPFSTPPTDDRMDLDEVALPTTSSRLSASTSSFAFFDLPAELRTQIYEELLVSDASFRLGHHGPFCLVDRKPTWPAILQTCKRAHEEATPVLYGANSFFLGTIGFKPIYSFSFFASIGPKNAGLIRKLVAHSTYPNLTTRSHLQHWIESLGIDFNRLKVLAISFETKPIEVTAMPPPGAAPIGVPLQAQLPPPVAANATLQSQNQALGSTAATGNGTHQTVNMIASALGIGATAAMTVAVATNGAQGMMAPATSNALWASTNNIVSSVLQMHNHNWTALPSTVAIPTASVIPSAGPGHTHTVSLNAHTRSFRFSVKDDDGQYEQCARREQLWLQKATTGMVQEFANVPNCDLRAGEFWLMYKDPRVRKLPSAR